MASSTISIAFTCHVVNPTRIEVRSSDGNVTTMDFPTGCDVRIVQSPWWVRLGWWARHLRFRARWAWGSS